jgi:hypothetical protein
LKPDFLIGDLFHLLPYKPAELQRLISTPSTAKCPIDQRLLFSEINVVITDRALFWIFKPDVSFRSLSIHNRLEIKEGLEIPL